MDWARYWQEPSGEEVVAATPAVRDALARVAEHVAGSPHVLVGWSDLPRPARDHLGGWAARAGSDEHRGTPRALAHGRRTGGAAGACCGTKAALRTWRRRDLPRHQQGPLGRPARPRHRSQRPQASPEGPRPTRAEVRTKLDTLRTAHLAGQAVDQGAITFAHLADDWLHKGLPAETAPTTTANYATIIKQNLIPALGKKRVVDLRATDIEAMLTAMADHGYSTRTMRLALNLTKRILTFAERRGIVLRNVASTVQPQRGAATPRRGLSTEHARALLTAAHGHRLHALITVSLLLGLRPGEATALTWDHVDLDATPPTIRIEASLRRDGNRMVLGPVKTTASRRTLALPHACITALQEQARRQKNDQATANGHWSNPHNLVFTTDLGTPLDPSNVRHGLQRIADQAGIGHVHPHLLRHAAASLLSAAGLRIEDIADTLGHRSITVTADVYATP